jgi:hypothetical protein
MSAICQCNGCTEFSAKSAFKALFAKLRKATISFVVSVCPSVCTEQLCSRWTDFRVILKFEYFSNFIKNLTITTVTGHEDLIEIMALSRPVLLRMTDISDKICRENRNFFVQIFF